MLKEKFGCSKEKFGFSKKNSTCQPFLTSLVTSKGLWGSPEEELGKGLWGSPEEELGKGLWGSPEEMLEL